jgi:hypothetical protein
MVIMQFESDLNRRNALQILAAGAAWAAGNGLSDAGEARLAILIEAAQVLSSVSQRVDFIAGALRGTTYRGFTLIGGPRLAEKFVVRDDGFDCVTFCETVLAAAMARDLGEFETNLKAIRYHNGVVAWRERNHYFFDWTLHNIDNKTCSAIAMDGAVELQKSVYWHRELGRRRFSMKVIPRAVMLANKSKLAAGDIIGFVTARPNLDYFHVGFIAFGKDNELLLRHASLSRRRVLDESMDRFTEINRVHYVTLLRAEDPAAAAVAAKKGG